VTVAGSVPPLVTLTFEFAFPELPANVIPALSPPIVAQLEVQLVVYAM